MSTGIQWTDETWNPVVGCTRVSAGCDHCYAFELHDKRYKANHDAARAWAGETTFRLSDREALTADARDAGVLPLPAQYDQPFSRVQLMRDRLEKPLHWKKPRRIFVNSMSDLFHEDVPDEFVDRVFAVMALTPQHTYQVLTKRPERMRAYIAEGDTRYGRFGIREACDQFGNLNALIERRGGFPWPLPNVWLGTSVEDQSAADERIPHLLETPAAVRFLSCEPLLGPVCVDEIWRLHSVFYPLVGERGAYTATGDVIDGGTIPRIHWVICGGESGAHARPFSLAWARSLRLQCLSAGVPFFMKQAGPHPYEEVIQYDDTETREPWRVKHSHGSDPEEWPEDLRVREFPEARG